MKIASVLFWLAINFSAQAYDEFGSAIDVRGVRYVGKNSGGPVPWLADAIFRPKPDYPFSERHLHHEGVAVFRLEIDLKTGMTTNVSMIQSSGFPKLDDVAFNTVRRWRLRPGKWREIEVPVVFTMSPLRPGEHFVRHGPPPRQNSRMAVFWERAFLRAFTITMAKSFGSISANESEPDWHLVDTSIKQMR